MSSPVKGYVKSSAEDSLKISVHASGAYNLASETFLLLMIEPPLTGVAHTVEQEQLLTSPTLVSEFWTDNYGNLQRRLLAPAGVFTFDYAATITATPNAVVPDAAAEYLPKDLPPDALLYTLPSRYCPSDRLTRLATDLFGEGPSGGARVNAVTDWVRRNIEYHYGTSDAQTSAVETLINRQGVCRDFAHLTIALLRALGIPARYVSGYAVGLKPCDFHAYVQAYVGGQWHNVDATYDGIRPAYAPIAFGRDAADVAMLTLFGTSTLQNQSVEVYGPPAADGGAGEQAKPL